MKEFNKAQLLIKINTDLDYYNKKVKYEFDEDIINYFNGKIEYLNILKNIITKLNKEGILTVLNNDFTKIKFQHAKNKKISFRSYLRGQASTIEEFINLIE